MNRRLNAKLENLATCMAGITVAHGAGNLTDAEALEAVSDLLEGFIPHDDQTDTPGGNANGLATGAISPS